MSKDIDFTKELDEADAAYVSQREWLARDAELAGFGRMIDGVWTPFAQDDLDPDDETEAEIAGSESETGSDESTEDDEEDEDEEEIDYSQFNVEDLKNEIDERNSEREDDDKIVVGGKGNKSDLIAALEADDAAQDESEDDE